jgi:hypothetical protein
MLQSANRMRSPIKDGLPFALLFEAIKLQSPCSSPNLILSHET